SMPKVERCNLFAGTPAPAVRETPILICEELGWAIEEEGLVAQLWIVEVRELEQKALHEIDRCPVDQPPIIVGSTRDDLPPKSRPESSLGQRVNHWLIARAPTQNVGTVGQHCAQYF